MLSKMNQHLLSRCQELLAAGESSVLVTVVSTRGSVPRAAGAKMLVLREGIAEGTIGGGKFESLAIEQALSLLEAEIPTLKTFPLHEADPESFGAICGGEVTLLFEPLAPKARLVLVGAGHCANAVARLALECGWHVTVIDDRPQYLEELPKVQRKISDCAPPDFIHDHCWRPREALVIVSRNYHIDRAALTAALMQADICYIGMIGSRKKVRQVFAQMESEGKITPERLASVFAPIGLDIGADSPAEISISIMAEILQVFNGSRGGHLRQPGPVL